MDALVSSMKRGIEQCLWKGSLLCWGGDGAFSQSLRRHPFVVLNQRSDYYQPNKDDAVPSRMKKSFSSQAFRSVCADILFPPPAAQRGFCSSSLRTTQILTCGITTAQHGKENIQGAGAK